MQTKSDLPQRHGTWRRTATAALLVLAAACGDEPGDAAENEAAATSPAGIFHVTGSAEAETAAAAPGRTRRAFTAPARVGLDATRRAHVLARFEGVLSAVHAELGDEVAAGDVLAELESRELAAARVAHVEALHDLEVAQILAAREERLWEREATSEAERDRARFALHEAELAVFSTRETLLALGVEVDALEALLADGIHAVEDGRAGHLTLAPVTAPIDGRVVARDAVVGEAVEPTTMLFEVADLSRLWVDADVPARIAARLSVGHPVVVGARDLDVAVEARVAYVDTHVEPGTQTALVRVVLDDPDPALRPGLFVELSGELEGAGGDVLVPRRAVAVADGRPWVFVARGDGRWEPRAVTLGQEGDAEVVVLEGLQPGERVASGDVMTLKAVWLGHGGEDE